MAERISTRYIVVHCSASQALPSLSAADIDRWHKARGFSRIGYHFVIKTNGDIQIGRLRDEIGAHVKGKNAVSVGICLIGGVGQDGKSVANFTREQLMSLRLLIDGLLEHYHREKPAVVGHRDLSPDKNNDGEVTRDEWLKDCPCFDVREWYLNRELV